MSELYSIILVEPITMAIVGTIGPFTSGPDAAHYATEDRDCQKDYHWTVVPTVKPVADDETEPTTCEELMSPSIQKLIKAKEALRRAIDEMRINPYDGQAEVRKDKVDEALNLICQVIDSSAIRKNEESEKSMCP
jgi:hypothetical protein